MSLIISLACPRGGRQIILWFFDCGFDEICCFEASIDLQVWGFDRMELQFDELMMETGLVLCCAASISLDRSLCEALGSKPTWSVRFAFESSIYWFGRLQIAGLKASICWFLPLECFDLLVGMVRSVGWLWSFDSGVRIAGSNYCWFAAKMASIYLMEALGNDEPLKTKLIENQKRKPWSWPRFLVRGTNVMDDSCSRIDHLYGSVYYMEQRWP